ncbi:MAG: hypothetical protein LBQ66_13870 [Planctomycetaceae bacterium]|jgi:hypothetical protein|nr:hypothetical protein [Planctomycetaceae bacterium]
MDYQWYEKIQPDCPLEQGDIVEGCYVIMPEEAHYQSILKGEQTQIDIPIIKFNGIILSQSCDITHGKVDSLIICPVISLKQLIEDMPHYKQSAAREDLRQGKMPAHHLLNKLEGEKLPQDFCIVDFHHIYSLPKMFLQEIVKTNERIRLLPPYREHLSQSFARYFMRVGLPSDIDRNEIASYGKQ